MNTRLKYVSKENKQLKELFFIIMYDNFKACLIKIIKAILKTKRINKKNIFKFGKIGLILFFFFICIFTSSFKDK